MHRQCIVLDVLYDFSSSTLEPIVLKFYPALHETVTPIYSIIYSYYFKYACKFYNFYALLVHLCKHITDCSIRMFHKI